MRCDLNALALTAFCLCTAIHSDVVNAGAPMTKRIEHFDDYHGTRVADPYRWLEADVREEPAVAQWVDEQNRHTTEFLEAIPERPRINQRLTELWNYEKFGTPFQEGDRFFFFKNDGLQNQSVLYTQDSLDAEPRVVIDPNTWAEDGTVALAGVEVSNDGQYIAYGVQDGGSDWRIWKILEVDSGNVLPDELQWIKFNSPAWKPDSSGFFYARFPEPDAAATFQNLNVNQKIYFHTKGTTQAEDQLVFHVPEHPEWGYHCTVSEDGRYLIITVHVGTDDRYRIFYQDLQSADAEVVPLVETFDNEFLFIANEGPVFYFKTDLDAPLRRVVAVDLAAARAARESRTGDAPAPPPVREILPEQAEAISDVNFVGGMFIVETLQDAKTAVNLYRPDGQHVRSISFPGIGSARGFYGRSHDEQTFYSFSSFATPPSIFRYDLKTGESHLLRQAQVDFDPQQYEVSQVFYHSKDGTRVPMFLAHKKGIELNGQNPTLLYAYGGFNNAITPSFSIARLAWMEMGGVFALANLRGGSEYGEEWHQAGMKLKKQNVFDDFIAAAEWLIENRYTSNKKLAIQGGSNGGLLVGACMTQRPELFGACLPAVGVMDMLRFHLFTAGRYWVDEYGSSDDPEEFRALLAYSPFHNIREGVCYPPTMVLTADTDDRVVPGHSFKFAAALQHAQACDNPILARIESRAGHGAGTPTSKLIEKSTDEWAFLVKVLQMKLP